MRLCFSFSKDVIVADRAESIRAGTRDASPAELEVLRESEAVGPTQPAAALATVQVAMEFMARRQHEVQPITTALERRREGRPADAPAWWV